MPSFANKMNLLTALRKQVKSAWEQWSQEEEPLHPQENSTALSLGYGSNLEKIYTFEAIDLKTVQPLNVEAPSAEMQPQAEPPRTVAKQISLDLGEGWRDWIPPCYLDEPIELLRLSITLQKKLREENCSTIGEVCQWISFWKPSAAELPDSLGLGHRDELHKALSDYLAAYCEEPHRAWEIQLSSWIRCSLCLALSPSEALLLLDSYGLADLYRSDVAYEWDKVRRYAGEARREAIAAALAKWRQHEGQQSWIRNRWRQLSSAFLIPWMSRRGGLASEEELLERLSARCSGTVEQLSAWLLLLDQYGQGWRQQLPSDGRALFFADATYKKLFGRLSRQIDSYFYDEALCYRTSELLGWLASEQARLWEEQDPTAIERFLLLSHRYECFKDRSGQLCVRLAPSYWPSSAK